MVQYAFHLKSGSCSIRGRLTSLGVFVVSTDPPHSKLYVPPAQQVQQYASFVLLIFITEPLISTHIQSVTVFI